MPGRAGSGPGDWGEGGDNPYPHVRELGLKTREQGGVPSVTPDSSVIARIFLKLILTIGEIVKIE